MNGCCLNHEIILTFKNVQENKRGSLSWSLTIFNLWFSNSTPSKLQNWSYSEPSLSNLNLKIFLHIIYWMNKMERISMVIYFIQKSNQDWDILGLSTNTQLEINMSQKRIVTAMTMFILLDQPFECIIYISKIYFVQILDKRAYVWLSTCWSLDFIFWWEFIIKHSRSTYIHLHEYFYVK